MTVKSLFPLPKKKSLFYLFDWGDEWVFKISLLRKRPHLPEAGISYPRVESETCTRPVQYPSDEDFYDEDEDYDEEDDIDEDEDTAQDSSDPEDQGDRG